MNKRAILLSAIVAVSVSPTLNAANVIWTGNAGDGKYTTPGNWSTGTVPTSADVATYQTTGATSVTNVPATNTPTLFGDATGTSDASPFTIGTTSGTAIAAGSGYYVTIGNATNPNAVSSSQVFNEPIVLGSRTNAGNITFANNSTVANVTLTVGGGISENASTGSVAGSWKINFSGNGNKIFNGTITEGAPIANATTSGYTQISVGLGGGGTNTGTTTLSNANTYTGGTTMGNGVSGLILGNSGALGTGTFTLSPNSGGSTISANTDLSGANKVAVPVSYSTIGRTIFGGTNKLELSGPVNLNASGASGAQTLQVDNTQPTTQSGTLSQTLGAGIIKTGNGTLILSGSNNAYTNGTTVSAGTLLVNNASGTGSGTGTGGVSVASGAAFGGNGTISGALTINAGAALNPGPSTGLSTGIFTSTSGSTSALVLNTGSTTTFDINGTTQGSGYDNVTDTTAGARITYGGDFKINIAALPPSDTGYHLFGFTVFNGSFDTVTLTGVVNGSLANTAGTWSGTYGGNTYTFAQSTGDLTIAAVPEPATALALVAGGALLVRRRRA